MSYSSLVSMLKYRMAGIGKPTVTVEEFSTVIACVFGAMVPVNEILKTAGIEQGREWEEAHEIEAIETCRAHLLDIWQPAHNEMNSLKPESQYYYLHNACMLASRAYGETLAAYVEYKILFISPQFMTKSYYRKRQDGKEWDSLASEFSGKLIVELERLELQKPDISKLLMPSGDIPEGLRSISRDVPDFLHFGAVASFN